MLISSIASCYSDQFIYIWGLCLCKWITQGFLGNKKSAYFKINRASELYGDKENKYKELKMCCKIVYLPTQAICFNIRKYYL